MRLLFNICVSVGCAGAIGSCRTTAPNSEVASDSPSAGTKDSWESTRRKREGDIKAHFASHARNWDWFEHNPLGFNGVPLVLLKTLVLTMPEIWTPDGTLNQLGFGPWPDDYGPDGQLLPERQRHALPYGLVWQADPIEPEATRTDNVFFACGACHTGRVIVDGRVQRFAGGTGSEMESQMYQQLVYLSGKALIETDDPDPKKIKLKADVVGKVLGTMKAKAETDPNFFYGDGRSPEQKAANAKRAVEQVKKILANKEVFLGNLISSAKKTGFVYHTMGAAFFKDTAKGKSPPLMGPRPGQMDAFGIAVGLVALHLNRPEATFLAPLPKDHEFFQGLPPGLSDAERVQAATKRLRETVYNWLPPFPAPIDIKSLWMSRDRYHANWDGNQGAKTRVLASGMSSVGDPTKVNVNIHEGMNDFIEEMPPPAYPFPVDMVKAARGELIYNKTCAASCHKPKNDKIYSTEEMGTDPNRAFQVSSTGSKMISLLYRETCGFAMQKRGGSGWCFKGEDGGKVTEEEIYRTVRPKGVAGYKADVLHGIWAQAPYLHNGSVPTLWHLLNPAQRPATFLRGNINYDQAKVGYVYEIEKKPTDNYRIPGEMVHTNVYDTALLGQSNGGHDKAEHGVNLAPKDKDDLLEYLKTL